MKKPDSTSGSDVSNAYNTVFIDTSLNTHMAMIFSDSDTVSDLKKKILYEHPSCFPNIGEININALKVKRKGHLYHLSDSMFVKSAFGGVSKSWFLSVDASIVEEHTENHNSRKPDTGNVVACFGITTNNSKADVVDVLPAGTSKRLSNINDASLPQDGGIRHAKDNSASQQFGFSNSTKGNSEDLHMEVEQTADSNSKVRPKVQLKDVGDDKISEDPATSVAASALKEKHKTKKRKKDGIHDRDVKENGAIVVESVKDTMGSGNLLKENSFHNGLSVVLNDMDLGNQVHVDETCGSLSSDRNKRSATGKRMADEETKVPGEQSECETEKHKYVSLNEQQYKSTEKSSQSGSASRKKLKAEKKDGNENSLAENGVLISDIVKESTGPDTTTSKSTLGTKLESRSAILDHLNNESVKENRLLTTNESDGRKKRKKQKSNPSQAGSEISSAKHVHVDTFQAIEVTNHKDLASEANLEFCLEKISMGGAISEPCLISSTKMQEASKTNRVPLTGGDDDMADTNDGNMESQNEAPEPDVVTVIKTRDSNDQNTCHVDNHSTLVSQKGISLQNDVGVSGQENQIDTLEDKILEPKKSFKKIKKSKKTKDPVGGTEAVDAVRHRGPASNISPVKCPSSVNGVRLSDSAKQDGTTDGKGESKMKKSDCLPSVTDVRVDDVIRDVLESLQQSASGPANAENMDRKSKKKTKKISSTVVDPSELLGKDDVDHRDPKVLADDASEVSASSKSTMKTVKVNRSSAVQLNESDLGSKDNTRVGISPAHMQLDSSQNTLISNYDGKPIQDVVDVDHPKIIRVDNANNSIEVPCESERVKSQHRHKNVDSGEILIDKVTDKKAVETEMKGKKKKKKKHDVQSGGSIPSLPSSQMLNGNQHKEAKPQVAKSSSIQSQRSSSKIESYSSNVQSSKPIVTVSESAVKEPRQSNKSDKFNSIPKDALRPIGVNSSRVHTNLDKNIARAVSGSALERSKNTIKEPRSDLDIAKANGSNNGKVVNSLANKKSLLATAGPIFKHDDKESSDDDDDDDTDASTRTPSDCSSSSDHSDDSHLNVSSSGNGSYNLEGEEAGGRNRQKPGSSGPKSMSLHAILRNSSSYKKAKLAASQDLDSQPDEFVPDSQAT